MAAGSPLADFCDEVMPVAEELVLTKQYVSAFFGTTLVSALHSAGVDTIVLLGCSTSGCIRATAVDGVQNGFRTIVVRKCVGGRHQLLTGGSGAAFPGNEYVFEANAHIQLPAGLAFEPTLQYAINPNSFYDPLTARRPRDGIFAIGTLIIPVGILLGISPG